MKTFLYFMMSHINFLFIFIPVIVFLEVEILILFYYAAAAILVNKDYFVVANSCFYWRR